eukprot:11316860-Ditylum_brightwellii.AAC.1
MKSFYLTRQKEDATNEIYLQDFNNKKDVLEEYGRSLGVHLKLVQFELAERRTKTSSSSTDEIKEAQEISKKATLVYTFLTGCNIIQHDPIW